ncbi:MAG: hypothetical protein PHY45_02765 [Rhodocyclaceae bacterium]|nr:hypothetical protein [Rhodocyclaceae bacterium]
MLLNRSLIISCSDSARERLVAFLLLCASVVAVSPIFGGLIFFSGNQISLISIFVIICIFVLRFGRDMPISVPRLLIAASIICFASINGLYWGLNTSIVLIYFLIPFLLSRVIQEGVIRLYTDYLTVAHLILLVGALIGFVYSLNGGAPIFSIENPDGRENGFFLTTFSNTYLMQFIRPSGLYDEPGALSFFTCMTVALRETLRMPRAVSGWLLLLGFITGSLAHLVFVVFYILHILFFRSIRRSVYVIIGFLVIGLTLFSVYDAQAGGLIGFYLDRLSFVDGSLSGDSRSALIANAYNYLGWNVFFWGLDGNCIIRDSLCHQDAYLKYGENPLTLLVHYGIFLSLAYYATLVYMLILTIRNKSLVIFAVLLLLLQRPNVMSYGYAVIIVIYIDHLSRGNKGRHAAAFG